MLTGCNNKNSIAGFPGSAISQYEVVIPDSCFEYSYTWGDSIKPFTENTKLVLGSYDGIDTRCLLRFLSLPSSADSVSNVNVRFKIYKNKLNSNTQFSIHKVTKSWLESQASWTHNKTDSNWSEDGGDFDPLPLATFTINASRTDSVSINLPASLIEYWVHNDSLNYGILIKQTSNKRSTRFVELYSSESYDSDIAPVLSFSYKDSDGDSVYYKQMSYSDTFIHNAQMSQMIDENILSMWNIAPKALAFKVTLPYQLFADADSTILSDDDLRFVTVNRAELILSKSDDVLPNTNTKNSVSAYLLNTPLTNQNYFSSDDYTFYHSTIDTLSNNTMKINVTGLIQAYLSKLKTNNGFLVKSNYQGMDFSRINYFNINCNEPSKRPKIKIKFSTLR
jgi:hypothetical protein